VLPHFRRPFEQNLSEAFEIRSFEIAGRHVVDEDIGDTFV